MPRLSVIIAARNEEKYLGEQLEAISRQAVQPDEIILVNDGSTDRTLEIMQAFFQERRDTKIVSFDESVGCAQATNRGVAESSGGWLYIASANDVMQGGAITAIARAIHAHPTADLIVGDVAGIHLGWNADQDGELLSPAYLDADRVSKLIGQMGIIHAAGAVISHRAWYQHSGWDPAFFPYSETLMWHATACRYGAVYTPDPIAWVRTHEGSASTTVLDREYRRPLMEMAAQFVDGLEEPARSRLIGSKLWAIQEWAPDMVPLLERVQKGAVSV